MYKQGALKMINRDMIWDMAFSTREELFADLEVIMQLIYTWRFASASQDRRNGPSGISRRRVVSHLVKLCMWIRGTAL